MGRKLIGFAVLTIIASGAYVSAPMVAAWQIREAVRSGDAARLEDKVDWPSVRKSLKSSLGETRKAIGELTEVAGLPRPGIWQRLKMATLPFLADPLIDRYVTAEGAPRLYAWRQTWRRRVATIRSAAGASADLVAASVTPVPEGWLHQVGLERILAATKRVKRWAFVSPMRFEIELADRIAQGRMWQAVLEMRGFSWKLTEMRVSEELPEPAMRDGAQPTPARGA